MVPFIDLACVAVGGGLGAGCRHLLAGPIADRCGMSSWTAIVAVNVAGCLIVGLLVGWLGPQPTASYLTALAVSGFAGGFTTFSTAMLDAWVLVRARRPARALVSLLATPILGIAAMLAGLLIGGGSS